jgi:hypothetical protein
MGKANYDLPDDKIARVIKLSKAGSKREAIIVALDEYLKKKALDRLADSYGKIPLKWSRKSLRKYRAS